MTRQLRTPLALLLIGLTVFSGCSPTQPFYLQEDGDLSHYLDRATELAYPDVYTHPLEEVTHARRPFRVSDPEELEFWDLTLEEVVSIALQNSKILRNLGGVTQINFADSLVGRTAGSASIYDVAIQESSPSGVTPVANGRGNFATTGSDVGNVTAAQAGGVEAALAAFDAQLLVNAGSGQSGALYSVLDSPNNTTPVNAFVPLVTEGAQGGLTTSIAKRTATGATFSITGVTNYDGSNQGLRALNTVWRQDVEIEAHVPLLRGAGTLVNRIPIVLARINADITAGAFEQSVKNAVLDIENTYWDLHCAYRAVETAKIGRDSAQVTWSTVNERKLGGIGSTQEEAQAREQYFFFRAALQQALRDLYDTEGRLRFLMGLAATDGRLVRPKDEPTAARVDFDWHEVHVEALARSTEIRQQKWRLKQRELELITAKNQLLPTLDTGVLYRWLGVGDHLIDSSSAPPRFPAEGSTAFSELTSGDYQEVSVFLDFAHSIGLRRELAGVRNAQLQIARSKAVLEDMELNTSHLISTAIRDLDFRYEQTQSQFNRWKAAHTEVESVIALYEAGKETLDLVLRAQERRANSQIDYYRALCEYNKALANVHFQKGSLLQYNNIFLAEGPWPEKAYYDALGHARERDASYYLDYGWSRPGVVSQGEIPQHIVDGEEIIGTMPGAEQIPTPAGQPADGNGEGGSDAAEGVLPEPADPMPRSAPADPFPFDDDVPGPITNRPDVPSLTPPRRAAVERPANAFPWDEGQPDSPGGTGLTPRPLLQPTSLR